MKQRVAQLPLMVLLAACAMPVVVHATEVIRLADSTDNQKRFMSLESERNGTARLGPKSVKVSGLHSDKGNMKSDFMLLDRSRAVPTPMQHSLIIPAKPSASRSNTETKVVHEMAPPASVKADVINDGESLMDSNQANPVLSLFNGGSNAPLSSFRDALLGKKTSEPTPAMAIGGHMWPIPAGAEQKLTSGFGLRLNPFTGRGREFHGGIDISAPTGTSVLASADGTITKTGADARYGKFIAITHNDGTQTHYGHLSVQAAHEGQRVQRGQTIGAVGATGRATGPHLDYRISSNGMQIDPMRVLSAPVTTTASGSTAPSRTSRMSIVVR